MPSPIYLPQKPNSFKSSMDMLQQMMVQMFAEKYKHKLELETATTLREQQKQALEDFVSTRPTSEGEWLISPDGKGGWKKERSPSAIIADKVSVAAQTETEKENRAKRLENQWDRAIKAQEQKGELKTQEERTPGAVPVSEKLHKDIYKEQERELKEREYTISKKMDDVRQTYNTMEKHMLDPITGLVKQGYEKQHKNLFKNMQADLTAVTYGKKPKIFSKRLDEETATKFLQQAGGDKDKARKLAIAAGYSL